MDVPPNNQDNQPQMEPTPPAKDKTNKKLLYGVIAGFGLLILLLIVMAVMLFSKGDEGDNGQSQNTAGTSENTNEQGDAAKKVVATAPAADDKLEYVIYEPTQTNSGTTIHFGVRNTCDECEEDVYTYGATSDFDSSSKSFLLDENAGKKYSTLTDADDNVISTPDCNRSLGSGETMDCFVTFSKVPSGSTVSWVFGNVRIDGIKVS